MFTWECVPLYRGSWQMICPETHLWERTARPASRLAPAGTRVSFEDSRDTWQDSLSLQSIEQTSINPQKTLSRRTLSVLERKTLRGTAGSWREDRGRDKRAPARAPDLVLLRKSSCRRRMNLQKRRKGGGWEATASESVPQGLLVLHSQGGHKAKQGQRPEQLGAHQAGIERSLGWLDFRSKTFL